jgi:membrane protease YdiL (CAAX protease family)
VKELVKICVYVCAVLLGGALLAPPLYWAAQGVMAAGWLLVLQKYGFQKYFNRSLLLSALVLFWPAVRWLGVRDWTPPLFRRDVLGWRRLGVGFGLGALVMGGLGAAYVAAGFYRWTGVPAGAVWLKALVSALVVGCLEEGLFRGAIAGLAERSGGRGLAFWGTSALFAAVHFLKPDPSLRVEAVDWASGFALVPRMFYQFSEPLLVLGGFGTLWVFGLVLALAARRTGSLWMSVGIHAGLVFVKLVFGKATERVLERLPWVGPELQIGVWPVLVLLLAGGLVWVATRPGEPGAAG